MLSVRLCLFIPTERDAQKYLCCRECIVHSKLLSNAALNFKNKLFYLTMVPMEKIIKVYEHFWFTNKNWLSQYTEVPLYRQLLKSCADLWKCGALEYTRLIDQCRKYRMLIDYYIVSHFNFCIIKTAVW